MATKLTLYIDEDIVEKAKIYAQKEGKSISKIFENYMKLLIDQNSIQSPEKTSERLKSLQGKIKVGENFNYKTEIQNILSEKYLTKKQ
jgi:predicted RecB family endonuclease